MESKRSTNLCSTYVLSLFDLNTRSFGSPDNFINSYVSDDESMFIINLRGTSTAASGHRNFKFDFIKDNTIFYVLTIPAEYKETVKKFREGKYSQFPNEVKDKIRKVSKLAWRVPLAEGGTTSAEVLLALDKDKRLKEELELRIGMKLPKDAELISIPSEDNFYKLNFTKSSDLVIIQ